VVKAGKALEEGGDRRAAWAAQNMMVMADPSEAGDEVGLCKLNSVVTTHSLKAPGFNP
jgi:hypothetical protein